LRLKFRARRELSVVFQLSVNKKKRKYINDSLKKNNVFIVLNLKEEENVYFLFSKILMDK
jgi:hypothetical protein